MLVSACGLLLLVGACSDQVQTKQLPAAEIGDLAAAKGGHSVAIGGHLYSLYVEFKKELPEPPVAWTDPMQALGSELIRLDPDLVFFLGDNTRYGREPEWDFLEQTFEPLGDRIRWGMGNHELRNMEAFRARGGLENSSLVHRGNKYILLDCKTILEPHDLEFLREELQDYESYDHVFLLTHYVLTGLPVPEVPLHEIDPYEEYTRKSNWDRDVVPIIAGKVSAVISGDHNDQHVSNYVQKLGSMSIQYIMTCFRFGRGDTPQTRGDGPMSFLELRFEGDDFQVLPRIVPLDARNPWYANQGYGRNNLPLPRIPGVTYNRHTLPGGAVSLELDSSWTTNEQLPGQFFATLNHGSDWDYLTVEAGVLEPGPQLSEQWQSRVLDSGGDPLELGGKSQRKIPGIMVEGDLLRATGWVGKRNVERWSLLYEADGQPHYLTMDIPFTRAKAYSEIIFKIIMEIRPAE